MKNLTNPSKMSLTKLIFLSLKEVVESMVENYIPIYLLPIISYYIISWILDLISDVMEPYHRKQFNAVLIFGRRLTAAYITTYLKKRRQLWCKYYYTTKILSSRKEKPGVESV